MRTLNPLSLILATLVLLGSCSSDPASPDANTKSGTAEASPWQTVKAPLAGESLIQPEVFRIDDPSQPSHFELPDGTTIEVPALAFVLPDGSAASAPVDLTFRSFREAAEIIASGIPMRVKQEDNSEGWMQTAGMFEIRFSSEGQPVGLAEGRKVEIGFVSAVGGAYDAWYFDETAGNWALLGSGPEPEQMEAPSLRENNTGADQQLQNLLQNPPQDPSSPESEILGFSDLDVSHIPELRGGSTVMLAYAGKDPDMSPANNEWVRDARWLRKKIEPTGQKGVYRLTLLGEKRYSIPVKAALQGENLEKAKARYAQELRAYKTKIAALRNRNFLLEQQRQFRRTLAVENGGIYNYDLLLKMEAAVPLMADFDFQGLPDAIKEVATVYLITGDNRTVIGFEPGNWERFRFLPEADNKLLAIMPGNKVAVFSQQNFKAEEPEMLKARNANYTFNMTLSERRIEKMADLQKIIEEAS